MDSAMLKAAEKYADLNDLPVDVVQAVIQVESSGRWNATRYERNYRWFWGEITNNQERIGQATSWGPMQVMGAVARELGFKGEFKDLCGPLGIAYGCMHLKNYLDRFGSLDSAIRAYNTGRPGPSKAGDRYLAKVKAAMEG